MTDELRRMWKEAVGSLFSGTISVVIAGTEKNHAERQDNRTLGNL
jgi:hypothetical protein